MSISRLHRRLGRALARMSSAATQRRPSHVCSPPRSAPSKPESTPAAGWQRDLLLKRGSEIYTRSMDREDRCAIAILDAEGIVISWHDYLPNARLFGRRVVSRHMSQFYLPEDVALYLPARHLSIAFKHGVDTKLGWRCRPGGDVFWAATVIQTILSEDGELLGYSHVTRSLRSPARCVTAPTRRRMSPHAASAAVMA
jgi:hypothetical protein